MKKLFSIFLSVAIVFSASAHNIIPGSCPARGTISVIGSSFPVTQGKQDSVAFYMTRNGNSNYFNPSNPITWDTGFIYTASTFTFTAPYNNTGDTIFITQYERNNVNSDWVAKYENYSFTTGALNAGGINSIKWNGQIINNACSLPITGIESFKAQIVSNNLDFTWTSQTETNNALYYVLRSFDGSNFSSITSVNSKAPNGNSTTPIFYSITISIETLTHTAGFNIIIGLLLISILPFSFLKYKRLMLSGAIIAITLITMQACTKNNDKILPFKGTEYFRLMQVDIDGNSSYSPITAVKF